MAKKRLSPESLDSTLEIQVDRLVAEANVAVHEIGRTLLEAGWFPQRAFDAIQITNKKRYSGKVNALRRPISLADTKSPNFIIQEDVLRSYTKEFHDYFDDLALDAGEIDRLVVAYSAATAMGEYAFRRAIMDPSYARTPARLAVISAVVTDSSDFTDHFRQRVDDIHLKKLMSNIDDANILEINGLRAGLTIVRSAVQEVFGADIISDELVLSANEALENYVHSQGPGYVGLAQYLAQSAETGVGAFTYAIPEWLYVLAVPMPSSTLETIFDERFVSEFGPDGINWSPSVILS